MDSRRRQIQEGISADIIIWHISCLALTPPHFLQFPPCSNPTGLLAFPPKHQTPSKLRVCSLVQAPLDVLPADSHRPAPSAPSGFCLSATPLTTRSAIFPVPSLSMALISPDTLYTLPVVCCLSLPLYPQGWEQSLTYARQLTYFYF